MNIKEIQQEVNKIQIAPFAKKTDKQLLSFELLSELYKQKYQGLQPLELKRYNKTDNRKTKLNKEQVKEIRKKYVPHVYGKKRLSIEYKVSASVIYRIIKGEDWKSEI
jgi:hypothetical protein